MRTHSYTLLLALALLLPLTSVAARGVPEAEENSITLYSGRGESLVQPLVEQFEAATGITVHVRYGGTAELAVLLQEEGSRSPADLFWGQDGGALGALVLSGLLQELPGDMFSGIPNIYRNSTGSWVATSGRARVLAYDPRTVSEAELPASIFDLTQPQYQGRVAWAPTNGSLQAFITAMRVVHGDDATQQWVEGMIANDVQIYRNNTAIIEAIGAGEIDMGITNNYYLLRFRAADPSFPVEQVFFAPGDIGNLVNVAGAGILKTAANSQGAEEFIRFLLSPAAQQYFTDEIYEYPVRDTVQMNPLLAPYDELLELSPAVDIDALEDLEGTLALLRRAGAL